MAHDTEKELVKQIEHIEKALDKDHLDPRESSDGFDPVRAAKIRHMIDWRLIPALSVMYSVSLMDRKNVSNAAVAGMLKDLHLKNGPGYNLVNMCFFITYVIFQFPMVVLCRKMGPRFFLPACCILWGTVVVGFGFSKTWETLIPLRLILGLLESGYFPGCCYLLSCWYTKCKLRV
jgi:sugar phosphate permease